MVVQVAVNAGVADLVKFRPGVGVEGDGAASDGATELGDADDDVPDLGPPLLALGHGRCPLGFQHHLENEADWTMPKLSTTVLTNLCPGLPTAVSSSSPIFTVSFSLFRNNSVHTACTLLNARPMVLLIVNIKQFSPCSPILQGCKCCEH